MDDYNVVIGDVKYYSEKDLREALGIAEDSDIFQCIKYRNHQLETLRTELAAERRMYHNSIKERNQFGKRLADIRQAAGMADAVMELATELQFNTVDKDGYDKQKELIDRLARLRFNICTALCLGGETSDEEILKSVMEIRESHDRLTRLRSNICSEFSLVPENCDGNIIGHIHMMQDCHDKLCKDYTELRKAIWDAMDRKPETLPEENARLVGEVAEIVRGEKLLIDFRDDVAKAIGMEYPTTNQVILNNVKYIYKDRKDAYEIVSKLNDRVTELEKAKEDLKQKFEFQSGLRRTWHARYESEHERANGVQKALDHEREACRVKDISLETAKKQYEKVCSNLEIAEFALNGMKNKVRELQEELNAERHPNPTEDIETHPIDTDPGYLRSGEEDSEE